MIRAVLSFVVRDFREIEEKKSNSAEEIPLDVIVKINKLFDCYFAGKLPDDLKLMTLDQKDILKPLLTAIFESCLQKVDLFVNVALQSEELVFCEIMMMLVNCARFKEQNMRETKESLLESCDVYNSIFEPLEDRLMLGLSGSTNLVSFSFLRYCLIFLSKVFPTSPFDEASKYPLQSVFQATEQVLLSKLPYLPPTQVDLLLNFSSLLLLNIYPSSSLGAHSSSIPSEPLSDPPSSFSLSLLGYLSSHSLTPQLAHFLTSQAFYFLFQALFEGHIGPCMKGLVVGEGEEGGMKEDIGWEEGVYHVLGTEWFGRIVMTQERGKAVDECGRIVKGVSSALVLFIENIGKFDEVGFDKKSRAVIVCLEKIALEVQEFTYTLLTLMFSENPDPNSELISDAIYCLETQKKAFKLLSTMMATQNSTSGSTIKHYPGNFSAKQLKNYYLRIMSCKSSGLEHLNKRSPPPDPQDNPASTETDLPPAIKYNLPVYLSAYLIEQYITTFSSPPKTLGSDILGPIEQEDLSAINIASLTDTFQYFFSILRLSRQPLTLDADSNVLQESQTSQNWQTSSENSQILAAQITDSILRLTFLLLETLNTLKDSNAFHQKTVKYVNEHSQRIIDSLQGFVKELERQQEQSKQEGVGVCRQDNSQHLVQATLNYVREILQAADAGVFSKGLKEYRLKKELLSEPGLNKKAVSLLNGYSDFMFLQLKFQTVLRQKKIYSYEYQFLPDVGTIYRLGLAKDLPESMRRGIIRTKQIHNVGGYCDIFCVNMLQIVNSALGMVTFILDIRNTTKIFFEEVFIDVETQGLLHWCEENHFEIKGFTAGSTRKLKLCYSVADYTKVRFNAHISSRNLAHLVSENNQVKIMKLESIAATNDIFEKKGLSLIKNFEISPLDLFLPICMVDLPNQAIRAFEERLLHSSPFFEVDFTLKGVPRTVGGPPGELTSEMPNLAHFFGNPFLSSSLISVTSDRHVYIKEYTLQAYNALVLQAVNNQREKEDSSEEEQKQSNALSITLLVPMMLKETQTVLGAWYIYLEKLEDESACHSTFVSF